jgi:hypothetical protein
MQIFKKTDRTLTLWQNNWPSAWIPLGAILTGFTIAMLYGQETKLSCYRATPLLGQCQLESNGFFTSESRSISLNTIQKVDLEASDSDEENSSTRVLLITKDGKILPVTLSGDAAERDQIASQLAAFLESPTASAFKVADGGLNFAYFMSGAAGLTCLAFFLFGGLAIVKFNKDQNECQVHHWSWKGRRIDRLAINHINKVELEIKKQVYVAGSAAEMPHRLVLKTNDRSTQPLSEKYSSRSWRYHDRLMIKEMNNFLGLDADTTND